MVLDRVVEREDRQPINRRSPVETTSKQMS